MQDFTPRRKRGERVYTATTPPPGRPGGGSPAGPPPGAPGGPAPYPAPLAKAAGGRPSGFLFGMSQKQVTLCCGIIALIVVLLVWLLLAAFLPGCQRRAPVPVSASSALSFSSAPSAPSFDRAAFSRAAGEYAGTVLGETEDAGDAYVADTLFIGDSNTARMITYGRSTGLSMKNAIGIESMGITSVTGLRCVRFSGLSDMTVPSAVAVMQPLRVVINYGTNNAGTSPESFRKSYQSAVEAIQEAWPYADIIIASVFPISASCTYRSISMSWVESINLALLELAQEMDLRFLNWSESITDPASGYGKAACFAGDGIHISEAAATALMGYFRAHSCQTEDTRPKPLKKIPARLPTPEGLFPKPVFSVPVVSVPSSVISSAPPPATFTVPSAPATAGAVLDGGWTVAVVSEANAAPAGTVLRQEPAAGAQVAAPCPITVFISDGTLAAPPPATSPAPPPPVPTTVPVPNAQGAANGAVLDGGWTVTVVTEQNVAPAGTFLRQEPAAGTPVAAPCPITVVFSDGTLAIPAASPPAGGGA